MHVRVRRPGARATRVLFERVPAWMAGRCLGRLWTCTSVVVATVAVVLGLCASGIPRQLGFFSWLAAQVPQLSGMSPAFTEGIEPGFDFESFSAIDLSGKTAVVTGANSGLGFATSLHLARQGASVVLLGSARRVRYWKSERGSSLGSVRP